MDKKIKTITIMQYDYVIRNINDEELDLHGHQHNFTEYNVLGLPLTEIKFGNSGDFEEMYRYEYNDSGELIRESYFPEENMLAEETVFVRDGSGRIVNAEKKYQDGSLDTIVFEYDDRNRLIRKTTTDDEGMVDQVESFAWEEDQMVAHEIVDGNGDPVEMTEPPVRQTNEIRITKDDKGAVILEEEFDQEGNLYMTVNRTYDDGGRAQEVEVIFDGRGKTQSRHYFLKYDYTFFE